MKHSLFIHFKKRIFVTSDDGDRQELQQKLDWALTHPLAMTQIAQAAKVEVQKFSETKMLKDTLEILQNSVH